MEEKRETGVQHFKLWLFAIIITMIFVLGRITAHADETDTVTDILTSGEEVEHDYEYVILQWRGQDTYLVLVLGTSGSFYYDGKITGVINSCSTGMNGLQGGVLTNFCSYDNETNKSATPVDVTITDDYTIVYSSTDIIDNNYQLVFQQTPLEKMGGRTLVETIPQEMGIRMGVILPVAVGCLALLVGLAILPKKLQIFLR